MKIVMTGGHHSSALPVIAQINSTLPSSNIYWFGHRYSQKGNTKDTLEYLEITKLGIPFYNLKAGKFYKTYDPIRLAKIPVGFFQALIWLIRINPDVIISFGGYLAVPTVLAASLLRIPSYTHEQTVVVGWANKLISKFVKKVFVSWPDSTHYFDSHKVIVSGLPIRPEIFKSTSNSFELNPNLPTIYITAGKTGSHDINKVVESCLKELLTKYNILHQTGDNSVHQDFERLSFFYQTMLESDNPQGKYILRKFVLQDEIGEAFNKAKLVVTRSGAHIAFELLALQKPALAIPISWVSHNEQYENALTLNKAGLGEILQEKELTPQTLTSKIDYMFSKLDSYTIQDENIKSLVKKDSAKIIVNEIINQTQA